MNHHYLLLIVINVSIPRTRSISDLGVTYSSDFSFSDHIHSTVLKANRLLGFIYRSSKSHFNLNSLKILFESLVVPILTYASVIWSPYTDKESKLLEGVYHRFLRYLCYLSGHPMDFKDHDYSFAIHQFKIPSIQNLHDYYDFLTVFKTINDITKVSRLKELFTRRTLSYNIREPRILEEYHFKSDFLHHSSIPRTIRKWNKLPSEMRSLNSVGIFKSSIKSYIYKF